MKEIILITGAKGMIAKRFYTLFGDKYVVRFLTRNKSNSNEYEWDIKNNSIDRDAFNNVNHIIHLAGTGIADKRWSKKRKVEISSSRIDTAHLILKTLEKYNIKIASFVSASAIGYYGTKTTDNIYNEEDEKGDDFLSSVCEKWEKIVTLIAEKKRAKRTVIFRIGIVLSKNEGVLEKMIKPINYYVGAVLGNGKQYIPWIHIDDLCNMIEYSLHNPLIFGTYNAVAPEHVTNKSFTNLISEIIQKPIIFPNIPNFLLNLFFGEVSVLLLEGSRICSKKIIEKGFIFKYPNIKKALLNLIAHE